MLSVYLIIDIKERLSENVDVRLPIIYLHVGIIILEMGTRRKGGPRNDRPVIIWAGSH